MADVSIIIPAFNEAERIGPVIEACLQSRLASEVLVVSDGSTDATVAVARSYEGVQVIDLETNLGKGGAMVEGARRAHGETLCFVDADLENLTGAHVDSILAPVQSGQCDMCLGIFRGGRFWSATGQMIFPYISGQRAIARDRFLRIPNLAELRFGVEIAIHRYFKAQGLRVRRVVLPGVSNCYKEEKLGLVQGIRARQKMYGEMYRAATRTRRRKSFQAIERAAIKKLKDSDLNQTLIKIRKALSDESS